MCCLSDDRGIGSHARQYQDGGKLKCPRPCFMPGHWAVVYMKKMKDSCPSTCLTQWKTRKKGFDCFTQAYLTLPITLMSSCFVCGGAWRAHTGITWLGSSCHGSPQLGLTQATKIATLFCTSFLQQNLKTSSAHHVKVLAIVPLLLAGFHVLWRTPAILDNKLWFPVSCTPGTCFVLRKWIRLRGASAIYNLSSCQR